jgi:FkbM family methyltransferase
MIKRIMFNTTIYNRLSSISRKLNFLPRGTIGLILNMLVIKNDPIVTFKANNSLIYISDLRSYTENYVPWTGEYEGKSMDLILPLIDNKKNMMDIGGNVGYWSINMKSINKNKLYVFEPVTSNYNRIKEHLKINNLENNTFVYNLGLSDKNFYAGFCKTEIDQKNNAQTFNAALSEGSSKDCEVQILDDIVQKQKITNIGFIKIDVEGYELKVFNGAKEFLAQNRPIIYGEFTPESIKINGNDPQSIYNIFDKYNFYQQNGTQFNRINPGDEFNRDLLLIPVELDSQIKNKFSYIN